jgi:hypothetical protein
MARYHYWQFLINQEGQPINSANISIYLANSTTPAHVYSSENGSTVSNTVPQTTTNSNGYFEFWISDDSTNNGYDLGQKFKIKWERSGITSGEIDNIVIIPILEQVNEDDNSSTAKNKLISNNLAYLWNTHIEYDVTELNKDLPIHGLTSINLNSVDETYNKIISDKIGHEWEFHKDYSFSTMITSSASAAHDLSPVDVNDTNSYFNKLVSNKTLNDVYLEISDLESTSLSLSAAIEQNSNDITSLEAETLSLSAAIEQNSNDITVLESDVNNIIAGSSSNRIIKSDTGIIVFDTGTGSISISADNEEIATWTNEKLDLFSCSLELSGGDSFNNFSTDGTFSNNRDNTIVSEKAIKTYIDTTTSLSGGGNSFPLILPKLCSLDDNDTAVARGNAFSMIETIDFNGSDDGSIWFTFNFPSTFDDTKDIMFDLYYNLNGSDDSKTVRFITDYWTIAVGSTPTLLSPDDTLTDDISTGTSNDGKIQKETLSNISDGNINSNDTIILRFKREGSNVNDTYTGTFQLLYIFMYQS